MKHWLYKKRIKHIPSIYEEDFKFGTMMHDIAKIYYSNISGMIEPSEVKLEFLRIANKKYKPITEKMREHIDGISRFEKERLSWGNHPEPISVEKHYKKGEFHGYVDVIFKHGEKEIVVDWKCGYKFISELNDAMKIQGAIYKYITGSDKVLFVFISTGHSIELTDEDQEDAKSIIDKVMDGIKNGKYNRVNDQERCDNCEYQIYCYLQQNKTRWWEFLP